MGNTQSINKNSYTDNYLITQYGGGVEFNDDGTEVLYIQRGGGEDDFTCIESKDKSNAMCWKGDENPQGKPIAERWHHICRKTKGPVKDKWNSFQIYSCNDNKKCEKKDLNKLDADYYCSHINLKSETVGNKLNKVEKVKKVEIKRKIESDERKNITSGISAGREYVTNYEIAPRINDDLQKFCNDQRYIRTYIRNEFENNKKLYNYFENHYSSKNDPRLKMSEIILQYKGVLFDTLNQLLIYRYNPKDFYDAWRKTYGEYTCFPNCQYNFDAIYILLQVILDQPRYDKEIILFRQLGREMGSQGFSGKPVEFLKENYKIGETYLNKFFKSTGMNLGEGEGIENKVVLKIIVPKEFPVFVYYAFCGANSLEDSEVVLPYTTDRSGNSLTYGLYVEKVEYKKIFKLENGTTKKSSAMVTCKVKMLNRPISIMKASEFQNEDDYVKKGDLEDLYEKDIWKDKIYKILKYFDENIKNKSDLEKDSMELLNILGLNLLYNEGYTLINDVILYKDSDDIIKVNTDEYKILKGFQLIANGIIKKLPYTNM